MICPKCGTPIEGGYRYVTCPNCGRTFDSTKIENIEESVPAPEHIVFPEPTPEPTPTSVFEPTTATDSFPVQDHTSEPELPLNPESTSVPEFSPAFKSGSAPTPGMGTSHETEKDNNLSLASGSEQTPEQIPDLETISDPVSTLASEYTPVPDPITTLDSIPEMEQTPALEPTSNPEPTLEPEPITSPEPLTEAAPKPVSKPVPVEKPVISYSTNSKKPWILTAVLSFCCLVGIIIFLLSNSQPASTNQIQDTLFAPKMQAYTNDLNLEILGEYFDGEHQFVVVKNNYNTSVDLFEDGDKDHPGYYAAEPGQEIVLFHNSSGIYEVSARESEYEALSLEFEKYNNYNNNYSCYINNPSDDYLFEESINASAVFYKDGRVVQVCDTYAGFPYIKHNQEIPISVESSISDYDDIHWCFRRPYPPDTAEISFNVDDVLKHIVIEDYVVNNEYSNRVVSKITNHSPFDLTIGCFIALKDKNGYLIGSEFLGNKLLTANSSRIDYPYELDSDVITASKQREYVFFVQDAWKNDVNVINDVTIEEKRDKSVLIINSGLKPIDDNYVVAALFFKGKQLVSFGYEYLFDRLAPNDKKTVAIDVYPDADTDADYDRVEWYIFWM